MKTRKGIYYFPTFEEARGYGATLKGYPAWRVVEYEVGFAVQFYPSGPYAGPTP